MLTNNANSRIAHVESITASVNEWDCLLDMGFSIQC